VSISSEVACKVAPEMGRSESGVSADIPTRPFPNDSKSSSSIQNSPEAAMVAVMIQMPSPVLRCCEDTEDHSYGPAKSDLYQIGVAQAQYVDSRC